MDATSFDFEDHESDEERSPYERSDGDETSDVDDSEGEARARGVYLAAGTPGDSALVYDVEARTASDSQPLPNEDEAGADGIFCNEIIELGEGSSMHSFYEHVDGRACQKHAKQRAEAAKKEAIDKKQLKLTDMFFKHRGSPSVAIETSSLASSPAPSLFLSSPARVTSPALSITT